MFNDFVEITDEDYEVNELGGDEEEEEEVIEEYGVTDLIDDEEYEKKVQEELFYQGFPKIEDIYNEGKNLEEIPENYTPEQQRLFRKGKEKIKKINEKYGCNLSFGEIVNYFDQQYERYQKKLPKYSSMFNSMSYELWSEAGNLAVKMEERKAYANLSIKKLESDLKQKFTEISKVVRLYAKIHPEKFPFNENVADVTNSTYVFDSKGKLRTTFEMEGGSKFNTENIAYILQQKVEQASKIDFEKGASINGKKIYILNHVKSIIDGKGQAPITQGEKVRRLAECVRFLRPLQAKRENRSILEYFTNKKVYIAERETLRQCKAEMKRLGLSKKEISKVLHGGAFNSVRFNDGMTVYAKQLHPEQPDLIQVEELPQVEVKNIEEKVKIEPEKVVVNDKPEVNENRNLIIVDDAVDNEEVLEFEIVDEDACLIEDYIRK
jgi:hypothetical protein